tara:strand:+ start:463 stop:870 length:408 start_codon:yes stop_codon:yes gene_type:complete
MTKIIYSDPEGRAQIITPSGDVNDAIKDVPSGVPYEIVDDSKIPTDRTFRNAWVTGSGEVKENLAKSKALAHEIRRNKRASEFKPHDEIISLNIPGQDAAAAETARVAIRAKYETMQTDIDNSTNTASIKTALEI